MIKVGQIGFGYWGPNLTRNFNSIDDVKVMGISDPSEKSQDKFKSLYPNLKIYNSSDEIINDNNIDVVVISTPAGTHYDMAKKSLMAGKHIFVEKPLALKVAECKELIDIAKKNNLIIFVGHTFLYNAAVNKVKEYIDKGDLGDIYYIYSSRLNLGRIRTDINSMWNLAPHDISILLYLLDSKPVQVTAKGLSYIQKGIEDVVFMNLDFENGISAHIHCSWLDPGKVRKMTIVGSRKMIVYDDVSNRDKIKIFDKGVDKKQKSGDLGQYSTFGDFQLLLRAGDVTIPKINFIEPLKLECEHFIECINENNTPLTDGYNGLRVTEILEKAEESLKNNGEIVKI